MATGPAGNGVQHLGPASRRAALLAGSATLLATGGIHLDLYLTGYRHIPTIGWLFLLQCVVAVLLGLAGLVTAAPAVALAGGGFAAATLGGYVLSLWTGLFGFHEIRTTAGVVAGALEVAGLVLLTGYAARVLRDRERQATHPGRLEGLGRAGTTVVAPLGALATLALVLAVTLAGPPGGSTATAAATRHVAPSRASRAGASSVRVTISNFAFIPAHVHVSPGERIVVTNKDSVTHTFTAMPGTTPVGHFTTGDIAPGTTKSVVAPTKPGTYHFYCQIHPFMTGTLTVG